MVRNCGSLLVLIRILQELERLSMSLQSLVGTPIYMAPEFFGNTERVRYNSFVDIYSMAMIIYLVYTGATERSFYPTAHKLVDLIIPKATGLKPRMDKLETDAVPTRVAAVIDRAMNADPTTRPSLIEFREVIQHEGLHGDVAHGPN